MMGNIGVQREACSIINFLSDSKACGGQWSQQPGDDPFSSSFAPGRPGVSETLSLWLNKVKNDFSPKRSATHSESALIESLWWNAETRLSAVEWKFT